MRLFTEPHRSPSVANAASMAAGSVRSTDSPTASGQPRRRSSSSVWSMASAPRARIATRAPSSANASAIARPIPLLPPVTTAALSFSPRSTDDLPSWRDPPHDQLDHIVDPVVADVVERAEDRGEQRRPRDHLEHRRGLHVRADLTVADTGLESRLEPTPGAIGEATQHRRLQRRVTRELREESGERGPGGWSAEEVDTDRDERPDVAAEVASGRHHVGPLRGEHRLVHEVGLRL